MAAILQTLADPTLAYALFVVGCLSVLAEIAHPGSFLPGMGGAVALLLAFIGLALLPVNWPSIVLIVAALSLFALDVKLTTHGGLTVAGLAAFAAGSLTLYNVPGGHAAPAIPLPLIVLLTVGSGALMTLLVRAAIRVRHVPSVNGPQRLLGRTGVATTALSPTGLVQVGGELWSAELCEAPVPALQAGQRVRVVGRRGLTLEVVPALDVKPAVSAGGSAASTA